MGKIKILRSTIASGKQLEAGCVCNIPEDISDNDARLLCQMGKAEEFTEETKPVETKPVPGKKKE